MDEPFSREEDLNDLERHIDDYEGDSDVSGFDEPPDDFGWDVEWIEEPSPEERWDDYLNREPEADRLQQLMDALGVLRCHRAELLQALFHVRNSCRIFWAVTWSTFAWRQNARNGTQIAHAHEV
jgi:hypothetical protein